MTLSVLIPTHNPRSDYLHRTLDALRLQSLPRAEWELLLIDNCSAPALPPSLVDWHPRGRVVPAPTLGLTHARITGVDTASGEVLVWVDDDNILAPDYLENVRRLFAANDRLGAAGGKSLPEYDTPPPAWYRPGLAPLGCRDLGNHPLEARWEASGQPRHYPDSAPIGAGLAVRRDALLRWVERVKTDPIRQRFGRTGTALTSGEDNDINLTLLGDGWTLAYEPTLSLTHLIPPRRLTLDYQRRIARASFRDFVCVLALHDIRPWPAIARWTVRLRQLKAWFVMKAWQSPAASIRWHGACGQIEGRSRIFPG